MTPRSVGRRRMVVAACAVTVLSVAGQAIDAMPPQARDPRAAAAVGPGSISGVITTDEPQPRPVRHATVTISTEDRATNRTSVTNDVGAFSFPGLAAGRYLLGATKPAYVRTNYGAKRPDRPGTPITLAQGQVLTGLSMKMTRGSVIAGMIQDETGRPMPGASVRIMQYRQQGADRVLAPVAGAGSLSGETTDDRGAYRIFGLSPGDYVVSVTPRLSGPVEVKQMTPEEIAAVMRALQQPPQAPTNPAGTTPAGAPPRPPATPSGPDPVMVGYTPIYFPGATSASMAQAITIGAGEERSGINFQAQLVRTAKVQGKVVSPDGASPQGTQLLISESGGVMQVINNSINITSPGPDGSFTFNGLAPGQYTITARQGGGGGARGAGGPGGGAAPMVFAGGGEFVRAAPPASGPAMWGRVDVSVSGQNLTNVMVNLQPGMVVSGKLNFTGVTAAPQELSRARITLAAASNPGGISLGVPGVTVAPNGDFTITGVTPGKYSFSATLNVPGSLAAWTLKSATAMGRDVTDVPFEVAPNGDISDAVLTFTDQTQQVSGALQDATGRPAPDYSIVVFPTDKRLWIGQSRRVKTTRPGTDGKFTVTGLPAGDYRIAAVTDMAPNEANDPTFLEQLVTASYAFSLKDGEKKVQDLKIAGGTL